MISLEPPPMSFGQLGTDHETHELRVAKLAIGDQLYWLFDRDGFVCSCSTLSELDELLSSEASARKIVNPGEVFGYWCGVRWKMHPEAVLARAREQENMLRGGRPQTFSNIRSRGRSSGRPELQGLSAADTLAALGLTPVPSPDEK